MLQRIGHLIRIYPIEAKLFALLFHSMIQTLRLDLFEDNIVLDDFFVFEEDALDLVERLLVDLEVLGDGYFLLLWKVFFDD